MQPSYFLGFELPEHVSKKVVALRMKFYDPSTMRQPLQTHVTLIHPDALHRLQRQQLINKARPILNDLLPISATITCVSMFGSHSIVLAIASKEIVGLYNKLSTTLPQEIISRYIIGKPFVPHITILQAQQSQSISSELFLDLQNQAKPLLKTNIKLYQASIFRQTATKRYVIEPI